MALPQKIVPTVGEDTQKLQEKQKRFLIKKGFSDENYTRPIPQMTYGGTDTRDAHYHGWDISIEKTPPRDKERQYQIERAFLLDKTSRAAEKVVMGTTGKNKTVYGI